jgi:hypothetical protein
MNDIYLNLLLNNMIFKKRITIMQNISVILSLEEALRIFTYYKMFQKNY